MANAIAISNTFMRMRLSGRSVGRKGALSLEMMGVIAIIAILVMSGLYYLNIMMRDTKINSTLSAMQLINTKASEMYMNEVNYSGLTTANFIKSGNAPSNFVSGNTMKSPWGSMTLAPGTDPATFTLTLDKIPEAVFLKLGNVLKGASGWQSLTLGGTAKGANIVAEKAGVSATANVANALLDGCQGNSNTMIFTSDAL